MLMKENIYFEYEIRKILCAIHLLFVKQKLQMFKSNIPFYTSTMLYYSGYLVINLKKCLLQNTRYGKCSAEIYGCSIEVLEWIVKLRLQKSLEIEKSFRY